jgi:hypothetical protein
LEEEAMTRDLWKALRYLFPSADPRHDYEIVAVGDGAPAIGLWNEALLGPQPSEQQIADAIAAYDAREQQRARDAAQLRSKVLTTAQSAAGVRIDDLTAAQVRALLACLLYQAGALDTAGVVQPLAAWLKAP